MLPQGYLRVFLALGDAKNTEDDDRADIRKLLIALLLALGVEAQTIAKVLGYKSRSAISRKFPVKELQKRLKQSTSDTK